MNILVCVKRVPLTGGRMVLTEDERAISTKHLGFTVSPHEECGAEEAVRLVEQHGGSSTVLTLGPPEAEEQLRDMMAIGIDQGIHLLTDGAEWDPQASAAACCESSSSGLETNTRTTATPTPARGAPRRPPARRPGRGRGP